MGQANTITSLRFHGLRRRSQRAALRRLPLWRAKRICSRCSRQTPPPPPHSTISHYTARRPRQRFLAATGNAATLPPPSQHTQQRRKTEAKSNYKHTPGQSAPLFASSSLCASFTVTGLALLCTAQSVAAAAACRLCSAPPYSNKKNSNCRICIYMCIYTCRLACVCE